MDLKALHSLMVKKNYHYFRGKTNDRDNNVFYIFSTLYNDRGNVVEVRIGDVDNDIGYWNNGKVTSKINLSDSEVFKFIEEFC